MSVLKRLKLYIKWAVVIHSFILLLLVFIWDTSTFPAYSNAMWPKVLLWLWKTVRLFHTFTNNGKNDISLYFHFHIFNIVTKTTEMTECSMRQQEQKVPQSCDDGGVPPQITAAPLEARYFSIWRCCYSWRDPHRQIKPKAQNCTIIIIIMVKKIERCKQ